MLSLFDTEKLSQLLQDFYEITRIRITVFDENRNELISYPRSIPPICKLIRSSAKGFSACMECDQQACQDAARQGKTWVYRCHAGLREAVTPLVSQGVIIGYLLFGHVMDYPNIEQGTRALLQACGHLPIQADELADACKNHPLIGEHFLISATRMLQAVAYYVIYEKLIVKQENNHLPEQLNAYIEEHLSDRLTVESLCRDLHTSKAQLYALSNQMYGHGIGKQIRLMRINRAKHLLREDKKIPLADVAAACGFSDCNYFITVFSREVGITPHRYRTPSNEPASTVHL